MKLSYFRWSWGDINEVKNFDLFGVPYLIPSVLYILNPYLHNLHRQLQSKTVLFINRLSIANSFTFVLLKMYSTSSSQKCNSLNIIFHWHSLICIMVFKKVSLASNYLHMKQTATHLPCNTANRKKASCHPRCISDLDCLVSPSSKHKYVKSLLMLHDAVNNRVRGSTVASVRCYSRHTIHPWRHLARFRLQNKHEWCTQSYEELRIQGEEDRCELKLSCRGGARNFPTCGWIIWREG